LKKPETRNLKFNSDKMGLGEVKKSLNLGRFRVFYQETIKNKLAVNAWIRQLKEVPEPKGRILITACRNATWIEWAVYCACVCRQMGYESTLLYKGSEVKKFYPEPGLLNFWSGVKQIPGIRLADLEEMPFDHQLYQQYRVSGHAAVVAALAYDFHIESADIIDEPDKYQDKYNELLEMASKNGARVNQYLKTNKFHQFICYSGIISDTNLILKGALDSGQETVCVEGWAWRPGHMIYNFGAPALEYNVKGWLKSFGAWNEDKEREMNNYFKFLDGVKQDSEWLKTFYLVQRAKLSEELPGHVASFVKGEEPIFLLASNVIGDSSLLNRETIFRSHRDFVARTIAYFSQHPQLKLIIRAHPAEEWVKEKVAIKLGAYARSLSEGMPNVLVIDSNEKVNTFSLIPFVRAGLIWITSAGVDFVVRGIPVISAADPKYHGLGIVEEPASADGFFARIDHYTKNEDRPTPAQIQQAKEYLYIVFKGFSFEAQGTSYRANTCMLNHMPFQKEHDRFYRILLHLEPAPDKN